MRLIYQAPGGVDVVIPCSILEAEKRMKKLKCDAQLINDDGECIGTVEWCDHMDAGPGWSWCIEK